jgi:hypothetical protein
MLILLLVVAVIGFAYYYLFWEKIAKKIEANKAEISAIEIVYNDYQKKIGGLNALKEELENLKSQPSNKDNFYSANEKQEIYMDFLQKLVADNNLLLESITFEQERIELPAAAEPIADAENQSGDTLATPIPENPAASGAAAAPSPYFNLTSAIMSFFVDYETPEQLLDMLDTIQKHDKMVVVDYLSFSVGMNHLPEYYVSHVDHSEGTSVKMYRCNAMIQFVSLIDPSEETPVDPEADTSEETPVDPEEADTSEETTTASSTDAVVDVPVVTS